MISEIKAGSNGLPPVKDQYDEYDKKIIAEAAVKFGAKVVADAYGMKWQTVVAWKKRLKIARPNFKIVIQSPSGQEITIDELLAKIVMFDSVYIRADQNAAYWVRGDEHGAVTLW